MAASLDVNDKFIEEWGDFDYAMYYSDAIDDSINKYPSVFSNTYDLTLSGVGHLKYIGADPKALVRSKIGTRFSDKEFEAFLFCVMGIISNIDDKTVEIQKNIADTLLELEIIDKVKYDEFISKHYPDEVFEPTI